MKLKIIIVNVIDDKLKLTEVIAFCLVSNGGHYSLLGDYVLVILSSSCGSSYRLPWRSFLNPVVASPNPPWLTTLVSLAIDICDPIVFYPIYDSLNWLISLVITKSVDFWRGCLFLSSFIYLKEVISMWLSRSSIVFSLDRKCYSFGCLFLLWT